MSSGRSADGQKFVKKCEIVKNMSAVDKNRKLEYYVRQKKSVVWPGGEYRRIKKDAAQIKKEYCSDQKRRCADQKRILFRSKKTLRRSKKNIVQIKKDAAQIKKEYCSDRKRHCADQKSDH